MPLWTAHALPARVGLKHTAVSGGSQNGPLLARNVRTHPTHYMQATLVSTAFPQHERRTTNCHFSSMGRLSNLPATTNKHHLTHNKPGAPISAWTPRGRANNVRWAELSRSGTHSTIPPVPRTSRTGFCRIPTTATRAPWSSRCTPARTFPVLTRRGIPHWVELPRHHPPARRGGDYFTSKHTYRFPGGVPTTQACSMLLATVACAALAPCISDGRRA